ncbi:MAG: flavin reductase [Nocardioidaceae bacterium]|nr:flavin reductase [Nocardioidaceae bacterium]
MTVTSNEIRPERYRAALGQYPTGVTAITATTGSGEHLAMIVGTFSSVSLAPPLVSFMAARDSASFQALSAQPTFCASVLAGDQEDVCRALSVKGATDKLAGVDWQPSPFGNPVVSGSLAWIECRVQQQIEAGDHVIVIGEVVGLEVTGSGLPLLFLGGGYGRFSPHSRVMPAAPDVMRQLRLADLGRGPMQELSQRLGLECALVAPVEDVLVRIASALPLDRDLRPAPVGVRLPFVPPMGAALVAWADDDGQRRWFQRAPVELSEEDRDAYRAALARLRERGWAVTLADDRLRRLDDVIHDLEAGATAPMPDDQPLGPEVYDADLRPGATYDVRNISCPVLQDGRAVMYLSVFGFAPAVSTEELVEAAGLALETTREIERRAAERSG